MMSFQCSCGKETLWTVTADIRLYIFMPKHMYLKISITGKFLLKNVTHKPSTFIVWLQQMFLELSTPSKALCTVLTPVQLSKTVNKNMTLHICVCLKYLPTERTLMRSSVAVCVMFVSMQAAWISETFVTQWTLVWLISRVDSHMTLQFSRSFECLVTHVTFVWFLSSVNSAVINKATYCCESFATNSTFKRSFSWMNSPVYC